MSDQYFAIAEGRNDGDSTVVFLSAMLKDEASPAQLDAFKKEGLEMVRSNESVDGMSAFEMTEELSIDGGVFKRLGNAHYTKLQ